MDIQILAERMGGLSSIKKKLAAAISQDLDQDELARTVGISRSSLGTAVSVLYKELELGFELGNRRRRSLIRDAWNVYAARMNERDVAAERPLTEADQTSGPEPASTIERTDKSHEPDSGSVQGYAVALSVVFQSPETIQGIRVVEVSSPSFERDCIGLIDDGYQPEILNDYQSMTHLDRFVARVIFVKRRH